MSLKGFNLLRKQAAPPTAWEKIYAWVLGTARVIVIIVEFVVIVSFVARIVVDTQAKQLEKGIESKQDLFEGFATSEQRYREIQLKSENYQSLWTRSSNYGDPLKEVTKLFSGNFNDLQITISADTLTIRVEGDVDRIAEIETQIKKSSVFKNVETFEIDTTEGGDTRGNLGIRAVIVEPYQRDLK